MTEHSVSLGHRVFLLAAGAAWLSRAVIGLYRPDYWNPHAPLDYAAVAGTSAALILSAIGIWGYYRNHPPQAGRAQRVWRWSIPVTCGSAFTGPGVSNFIEDALHVEGLGYVWVFGILAMTAGLLCAGLSSFRVQGLSRWTGISFLIAMLGLLLTESNGQFGTGAAFPALGLLGVRRKSGAE